MMYSMSMTQTSTATQTPTAATLRACTTRDEAAAILRPLRKSDLRDIAGELGMRTTASQTRGALIDRIVNRAVGSRLDSAALRGL